MKNEKVIEVLNDLIRINEDRIEGYEKAADNTEGADETIKALFYDAAEKSEEIKKDLTKKVLELGGKPSSDSTTSGKIYRAWMDVKATFTGHDVHSTLESCEYGEDAAQKAYKDALENASDLPNDVKQLISSQQSSLRQDHNKIKSERDNSKVVSH